MDVADLPNDLILLIVAHLSARTIVLCRRVSKSWHAVFTAQDFSLQLLKDRFPRCRELRLAYVANGGNISAVSASFPLRLDGGGSNTSDRGSSEPGGDGHDWCATFALVAGRYHHLYSATPRSVSKIRLGINDSREVRLSPSCPRYIPVQPWNRHLRLGDGTAAFNYPDPSWCYSQDLGLLVYHVHPGDVEDTPRAYVYPWRLLDLESGKKFEVAFPHDDNRSVRHVRLADGVLVFEWCDTMPHRNVGSQEYHKHYVTALDVVRVPESSLFSASAEWDTIPRAEWALPDMSLTDGNDRFLSTHTGSHYAIYVWRSSQEGMRRLIENAHNECALVWDMSSPTARPRLLRNMKSRDLAFYGVRQQEMARLRRLGMDERNLYFVEEEHRWASQAPGSSSPRAHLVRSTGVPVIPGPVEVSLAFDGDEERAGEGEDIGGQYQHVNDRLVCIVKGPRWRDECGADGDVHLSFCTRVDRALPRPHAAGATPNDGSPGIWNGSLPPTDIDMPTFAQGMRSAVSASPTRWPGWAPCWRHEDFPYLTVSEMVDFKAGVRIVARSCFMLESLSVHIRPSLSVRRSGVASAGSSLSSTLSSPDASSVSDRPMVLSDVAGISFPVRCRSIRSGSPESVGKTDAEDWEIEEDPRNEVRFADEMWDQLLGNGYICGDERWLVGESKDTDQSITIVRF